MHGTITLATCPAATLRFSTSQLSSFPLNHQVHTNCFTCRARVRLLTPEPLALLQAEEDSGKRMEKLRRASLDQPSAAVATGQRSKAGAPQASVYHVSSLYGPSTGSSGEVAAVQGAEAQPHLPGLLPRSLPHTSDAGCSTAWLR